VPPAVSLGVESLGREHETPPDREVEEVFIWLA